MGMKAYSGIITKARGIFSHLKGWWENANPHWRLFAVLFLPLLAFTLISLVLTFTTPTIITNGDSLSYIMFFPQRMPLVGLLVHGSYWLGGELAVRLLWQAMNIAGVILASGVTFLLLRSYISALAAMLLCMGSLPGIFNAQTISSETPTFFLTALTLFFLLLYLGRKNSFWPLYASIFAVTALVLVRSESILLYPFAGILFIIKNWLDGWRWQELYRPLCFLLIVFAVASLPLLAQCYRMNKAGYGWCLQESGYTSVGIYDGAVVNASEDGFREGVDVTNPAIKEIRKSIHAGKEIIPPQYSVFTKNCWADYNSLLLLGKSKEEAGRLMNEATKGFYLRDLSWSAKFLLYKVINANIPAVRYLRRYSHPGETDYWVLTNHQYDAKRVFNEYAAKHGYAMRFPFRTEPYSDMLSDIHHVVSSLLVKFQMLVNWWVIPITILGVLSCFWQKKRLLWLCVLGFLALRCLMIPGIAYSVNRLVSPGYFLLIIFAVSFIYWTICFLRGILGKGGWSFFKDQIKPRRAIAWGLILLFCAGLLHTINSYQALRLHEFKSVVRSGNLELRGAVFAPVGGTITSAKIIDWRTGKEWSTKAGDLAIKNEDDADEKNDAYLLRAGNNTITLLALNPPDKNAVLEIELEVKDERILWSYVTYNNEPALGQQE